MSDLREKVAKQIYIATALNGKVKGNESHVAAVFGPERRSGYDKAGDRSRQAADAAIKVVLGALKEPSDAMVSAGLNVPMFTFENGLDIRKPYRAMIHAFTRDHYLSALAEEDGKEL